LEDLFLFLNRFLKASEEIENIFFISSIILFPSNLESLEHETIEKKVFSSGLIFGLYVSDFREYFLLFIHRHFAPAFAALLSLSLIISISNTHSFSLSHYLYLKHTFFLSLSLSLSFSHSSLLILSLSLLTDQVIRLTFKTV